MVRFSVSSSINIHAVKPLVLQLYPFLPNDIYHQRMEYLQSSKQYEMAYMHYEDDTLIGICGLWFGSKLWCGSYCELDNLIIDAAHRGRGYSRLFMDYLIQIATERQCNAVALDVVRTNEQANRLYDTIGFDTPGYHRMLWLNNQAYFGTHTVTDIG